MGTSERENLAAWREKLLLNISGDADGDYIAEAQFRVSPETSSLVEVLAFRLGSETFGFDILSVSEILRPRSITKLPRAPEFILGVISLRGMVLSVADTARRLGIGTFSAGKGHRIIIVNDGEEKMGFAVDAVVGVVRFAKSEIENTNYVASVDPAYLMGIGYDSKRQLVALLATEKLCDFRLEEK